ncbi:MAG: CdaR family protein [Clostridia bacterium]|nr:CdaR family protein [Clostridia bacterium]
MSELFKKDITIRIISVVFAVILWFFVLDSNNPIGTSKLTIQLDVRNEQMLQDRGIYLKNKNYTRTIDIFIKGRKEKTKNITANDFHAVLDFAKVESADVDELPIEGPVYIGKEDLNDSHWEYRPKVVKLELEKIEKNPYKVEIVTTGKAKEGYKIIRMTANPEIVSLQGVDSLIKSVASIKTFVDVTGLDRDMTINKKECKVYNKSGEEIIQLSRNLTVEVKLEVAKEVSVVPVIVGKPAKNYIDGIRRVKPDKVLITGSPDILEKVTELKTEPVDIENINSSLDVSRLIILPEGVKLLNTSREAAVSVLVEEAAVKEFVISSQEISFENMKIDNSLKYAVLPREVKISIKGKIPELENLVAADLHPRVDVFKLEEGTHKLPLLLDLPQDTRLEEDYTVEIKIEKR